MKYYEAGLGILIMISAYRWAWCGTNIKPIDFFLSAVLEGQGIFLVISSFLK